MLMDHGTLVREVTLSYSLLNEGYHLKERICSRRSKFFPLRIDLFLEGFRSAGKQTGRHKSCSFCKNSGKTWSYSQLSKVVGVTGNKEEIISSRIWKVCQNILP